MVRRMRSLLFAFLAVVIARSVTLAGDAQSDAPVVIPFSPAVLPGSGLSQHPFFYAGLGACSSIQLLDEPAADEQR